MRRTTAGARKPVDHRAQETCRTSWPPPTTATAEDPAKWTTLPLPGPRNSRAKESAPATSARCSEHPAPRSTDTLYRQRGERSRQRGDDIQAVRPALVRECPARPAGGCRSGRPGGHPSDWHIQEVGPVPDVLVDDPASIAANSSEALMRALLYEDLANRLVPMRGNGTGAQVLPGATEMELSAKAQVGPILFQRARSNAQASATVPAWGHLLVLGFSRRSPRVLRCRCVLCGPSP